MNIYELVSFFSVFRIRFSCCLLPSREAERASEAHAHQLQEQLEAANLAKAQLAREVSMHAQQLPR